MLLSASKLDPDVIAPSPTTVIVQESSFWFAAFIRVLGNSESDGQSGARVSCGERVVRTLARLPEPGQSAL